MSDDIKYGGIKNLWLKKRYLNDAKKIIDELIAIDCYDKELKTKPRCQR